MGLSDRMNRVIYKNTKNLQIENGFFYHSVGFRIHNQHKFSIWLAINGGNEPYI